MRFPKENKQKSQTNAKIVIFRKYHYYFHKGKKRFELLFSQSKKALPIKKFDNDNDEEEEEEDEDEEEEEGRRRRRRR